MKNCRLAAALVMLIGAPAHADTSIPYEVTTEIPPGSPEAQQLQAAFDWIDNGTQGGSNPLDTPNVTFVETNRANTYGSSDFDTIAINFDAHDSVENLAATIIHELKHVNRARAAGTQLDNDGSARSADNPCVGVRNHLDIACETLGEICALSQAQPNLPDCTTIEEIASSMTPAMRALFSGCFSGAQYYCAHGTAGTAADPNDPDCPCSSTT